MNEKVKIPIKTDVLELDEMCINFKKSFGSGQQQIEVVKNWLLLKQEIDKLNILKIYL